ncbi:MAG TPA: DUF72 domain-containing protein, partial [Ktedonobacteraceae bacterium]|nr:DUF72 domain-containing protein [Ktedonobacteraceae bacterium]
MLYIGCPMWGYKEWVGNFFPPNTTQSAFLRLYSRRLTSVEGNTSFYAVPDAATIARWRGETPDSFRFCFKIPREISHTPRLDTRQRELQAFLARMRPMGERLGPFFLQLPPAFGPKQIEQLAAFLDYWPTGQNGLGNPRLAVEVRHPDFYQEPYTSLLDTMLKQHQVARVIMDTRPIRTGSTQEQQVLQARERKPDLPLHIAATADYAFVRYIGHPRMEVNDPLLDAWAERCAHWIQSGMTLYIFCHCPFEVHSPDTCRALYERVRR